MQKLFIISNESIYQNNNEYFCDNIDLKSTPEGLNKNLVTHLIERRKSYQKLTKHQRYYEGWIIFRDRKILNILYRYPYLLGTVKQHLIKKTIKR